MADQPWVIRPGDDPRLGYCRICRAFTVQRMPGYYEVGVCSRECFDELQWRKALQVLGHTYRPKAPKEANRGRP